MANFYLENIDTEKLIYESSIFETDIIKETIFNFYSYPNNRNSQLFLYKECNSNKTVGDTLLYCFLYVNGKVVKEIYRGNKTYYKEIRFIGNKVLSL